MYHIFHQYNIFLEGTILKTNFICPGIYSFKKTYPTQVEFNHEYI